MPTVTTPDQTQLYVKDWGTGRPVILLHGWPMTCDTWDEQAMALAAQGFRAIAYDRRGFGRSSQPWSGYDYDTLADDLAAVIAQTGAKDATLVGFSMGGGEVARYMSRHAGKSVAQAVLVSSILPYRLKTSDNPAGADQQVFDAMAQALKDDRPQFLSDFLRDFYGVGLIARPVSAALLEWVRSISLQASLKATLDCLKFFATTDFRPDLGAFNVPTLFIHGTHDKIVPIEGSSRIAAARIPQSQLLAYDEAPHGLLATDKARLSADLLHFLKG